MNKYVANQFVEILSLKQIVTLSVDTNIFK